MELAFHKLAFVTVSVLVKVFTITSLLPIHPAPCVLVAISPHKCPVPVLKIILICPSVCIAAWQFVSAFPVFPVFQKLSLIGRSIRVGNRPSSFVSIPHSSVDVSVPVSHLSLPVLSPVLELPIIDVPVPMTHDAFPLKPAVDEVSFVLVKRAVEENT